MSSCIRVFTYRSFGAHSADALTSLFRLYCSGLDLNLSTQSEGEADDYLNPPEVHLLSHVGQKVEKQCAW